MSAESIYDPISIEALRAAKSRLVMDGLRVEDWALQNGFKPKTVHNVLGGRRKAIRGQSLKIAILLGLRPQPTAVAHGASSSPAGHTVAGGPSIASCDRRPKLQDLVGEAAR